MHKLPLHGSAKVGATGYLLDNGCAVLVFKGGVESDHWRGDVVDFDAVKTALEPRGYDHLVVLYPSMLDEDAALEAVASEACARAIAAPAWGAVFEGAGKDLKEVRGKLAELFKANPWLEKSLTETAAELGTVEQNLQALALERSAVERRWAFEACEDAVERAERFRVEEAGERAGRINEHTAELFAKEFLKTYRKQVETSGLMPGEEPALFRAYPYRIEALLLSNRCVVLSVRRAPQAAGFATIPSDFARAKALLDEPSGAFIVALDNDARLEAPEARFLGEQIAAANVEDAKCVAKVRAVAAKLQAAEKDVLSAGKINPWLEGQAMKIGEALLRSRKSLEQVLQSFDGALEKGVVLRTEVNRSNLEVAPHGRKPVLAPVESAAARAPRAPKATEPGAALSAAAAAVGTTKAQAPSVQNVPEQPEHVFQEVDYYNFPQSSTVRAAESAGAAASVKSPVVDMAPPPAPPQGAVDAEVRARVYDLETRLNEYERRLYYMDKYTEMIQKQQLDKVKLLRDLMAVEGKRNRARAYGISVAALVVAVLALIAIPDPLGSISAFLHGLGL